MRKGFLPWCWLESHPHDDVVDSRCCLSRRSLEFGELGCVEIPRLDKIVKLPEKIIELCSKLGDLI
jgi:hypothetical protein